MLPCSSRTYLHILAPTLTVRFPGSRPLMDGGNDLGLSLEDRSAPYSRDLDMIAYEDAQALSEGLDDFLRGGSALLRSMCDKSSQAQRQTPTAYTPEKSRFLENHAKGKTCSHASMRNQL